LSNDVVNYIQQRNDTAKL